MKKELKVKKPIEPQAQQEEIERLKTLLKPILNNELLEKTIEIFSSSKNLKEIQMKLYLYLKDHLKPFNDSLSIAKETLEAIQRTYIKLNIPVNQIPRNLKLTKTYLNEKRKWLYLSEIIGIVKFIKILPLFKEYLYKDTEGNDRIKYIIPASLIQEKKTKKNTKSKERLKSILF